MVAVNIKLTSLLLDFQNQAIKNDEVSIYKVGGGSVLKYWEKILQEIKIKHSALYYKGVNSAYNKLKSFSPHLTFDKLKLSDIRAFETHLIGIGNNRTTIHHNLKRFKYICSLAVKEGLMEYHKNPFLNFKLETSETKKPRLSYKQILEIEKLDLETDSQIWHIRNYWLFSFYCAGIRFGDLCRLQRSNIRKVGKQLRLIYTMNKTTKNRNILLTSKAVEILGLYSKPEGKYLFPIVKKLPEDKFKELAIISNENAKANKQLKNLEKKIISDIKISFHSSRHSFADYAKQQGLDLHTIKELLGHDKISTTETYMKSFYQEETDQAITKLFK